MNVNSFWSPKLMAGAAFVGLVGAAGVFIYEQVYAEKRRAMLVSEVQRLDRQMTSMRQELEALRELQKETKLRRERQKRIRREARARAGRAIARQGEGEGAGAGEGEGGDVADGPERSYASDSEYFTDYQSVLGTDAEMDSEEFYDVHTDEDDTLRDDVSRENIEDQDLSDKTDKSPKHSPRNAT